jgi:hypothetical protein
MSEGPPKTLPQAIESKESPERPPRYRTIEREVIETKEDGTSIERVVECNGLLHRRCVDAISYDESGEIIFVDQLSREELGACDKSHS